MHHRPEQVEQTASRGHGRHRPSIVTVLLAGAGASFLIGLSLTADVLQVVTTFGWLVSLLVATPALLVLLFIASFWARPSRARTSSRVGIGLLAAVTVIVAFFVVPGHLPHSAQEHSISGLVRCESGADIAGMYILDQTDAKHNGFVVSLNVIPATAAHPQETRFTYDSLLGSDFIAHVGCGHIGNRWAVTANSPSISATYTELVCSDEDRESADFGKCAVTKAH
jgi:hypothetical protein